MNNTLKLALGAVLTAGLILPVFAQDNFPDVPDNHWAYEALARLKKDGLLVGYPDGLYRGNRPASRYELAVAINAVYQHLKSITDGLQAEIDDIKGHGPEDLGPLKDEIQQLQDEVNSMKGWGDDIDNLKKLADQFQKELASLGVDVEGLKKDLSDLAKRVGVLEAHRLPIDIHGDANLFLMAGASDSHRPGITVQGRPVGVREPYGAAGGYDMAGMDVDSTIYHELDLRLNSNNENGPKWHSDVAISNFFGDSFYGANGFRNTGSGFQSMTATSTGTGVVPQPFSTGLETVYVQDMAVDFDTSIVNQGLAVELGRTGYSIDPYMFQRPNPNPYFQNDRWGDGKWYFDGGILGFHWGGVGLTAFGGKQDQDTTTGGTSLDMMGMQVGYLGHRYTPGIAGSQRPFGLTTGTGINSSGTGLNGIPVDEDLGLHLHIPISSNGKLDLAYIWFESNQGESPTGGVPTDASGPPANTSNAIANRADVYGGDLKWNFGSIVFAGGYAASDLKMGNTNLTSKDNFAWHAQLAYDANRWGLSAGYRDIEPQYGAPGDWGRIGIWWNPTDIKGPMANLHFNISNSVKLTAGGEWYNGTGDKFGNAALPGTTATSVGLSTHDRIDHYTAELGWRMNDAWNLTLGTELVYWHLPEDGAGLDNPTEMWYNLGLGYNLSDQARLSFLYQWSNYDSKTNPEFQIFNGGAGGGGFSGSKYTGSLLTTQLTVKF